jgi:eukaryotic-like serine/threonine-protein kinase
MGPYRVVRRLGQGAAGQVFLAHHPEQDRWVAIKVVRSPTAEDDREQATAIERFHHGLTLARQLDHPDLAQVFEDGTEGPWTWVAMEALKGHSLERYTQSAFQLPDALALHIAERLAHALAHAHERGVLHRDVKPANVVVHLPENRVKLTDFGLSSQADSSRTQTGVVLGSPAFMAPEQLAGAPTSTATDTYALAVLTFQLLTCRLPFAEDNLAALLFKVANEAPPRLAQWRPDLPSSLDEVLAKGMARTPGERFRSAHALAQALANAAQQLPSVTNIP